MCGIVGLFLKQDSLQPRLGALLQEMLDTMNDRGPDSAGFAVYRRNADPEALKLTIRAPAGSDPSELVDLLDGVLRSPLHVTACANHAVVHLAQNDEGAVRTALEERAPDFQIVGAGKSIELYKDVGSPDKVTRRFSLDRMAGSHGIGHTRMATESAVTIDGAHPYTTGLDFCLVHNGSLSNHNTLRRTLMREGLHFETENDTEVAAGFIAWRLREGDSLAAALEACLSTLDGFYTFVVGTETGFAVLRDPISCKPAVMAETDDWVAFGSEYRALAHLPGIESAQVWEPEPAHVYAWNRAA